MERPACYTCIWLLYVVRIRPFIISDFSLAEGGGREEAVSDMVWKHKEFIFFWWWEYWIAPCLYTSLEITGVLIDKSVGWGFWLIKDQT